MPGPNFLEQPLDASNVQVYQPFPPSRQGEWVAWGCAAMMLTVGILRQDALGRAGLGVGVLGILFLASALLIRFGSWMAVHTSVSVDGERVCYSTPFRRVESSWQEVEQLRFEPRGASWRVWVFCEKGDFHFDMPAVLGAQTSHPAQVGIEYGEQLAAVIWQKSGFEGPHPSGTDWVGDPQTSQDA